MKNASAKTGFVFVLLVFLLLVGLPVAVWLDLRSLADSNLRRQASDLNSIITSVRGYYAANVVDRILAAPGTTTKVVNNYEDFPGAIPLPATLSLELGGVITQQQHNITYRFVSDYPFANRAPHALDEFETDALRRLRQNSDQMLSLSSHALLVDQVRWVAPVIMGQACVTCHNDHPQNSKRDWKVGDVRGVVEIIRPLERDVTRTRDGLRETFVSTAVLFGVLAGIFGLVLVLGNRRRTFG
jgi:adenylate cyclase